MTVLTYFKFTWRLIDNGDGCGWCLWLACAWCRCVLLPGISEKDELDEEMLWKAAELAKSTGCFESDSVGWLACCWLEARLTLRSRAAEVEPSAVGPEMCRMGRGCFFTLTRIVSSGVSLFLAWLRLAGVQKDDLGSAERFWLVLLVGMIAGCFVTTEFVAGYERHLWIEQIRAQRAEQSELEKLQSGA